MDHNTANLGRSGSEDAAERARSALAGQFDVAGRRGLVRRALLPLTRHVVGRTYNAAHDLADGLDAAAARQRRADAEIVELRARLDELTRRAEDQEQWNHRTALRLSADEAELDRARVTAVAAPGPGWSPTPTNDEVLDAQGYLALEARFRGSPEVILERQRDAARHVASLAGGALRLLDLGCGRGEWLQVLTDIGVAAYGVDSNPAMVEHARSTGLDVRLGDLMTVLEQTAPASLGAVSGFHVAEHLPLPVLGRLLSLAFAALAPGGILLLETPNPQNLQVGSASFYLDPTHLRPVNPLFLQFFADYHGFTDTALHYVHPNDGRLVMPVPPADPDDPSHEALARVTDLVFGAQDCLLVARRPADPPDEGAPRWDTVDPATRA